MKVPSIEYYDEKLKSASKFAAQYSDPVLKRIWKDTVDVLLERRKELMT